MPNVFRVFGVGDSFTFGDMVPEVDTYLRVAEEHWNADQPYPIEVYNGGVQAYDLYQYSIRMEEAFDQDAQLITIGLLPNDLFSALSQEKIAERADLVEKFGAQKSHEILYQEHLPSKLSLVKQLLSYSRFFEFFTHVLLSNEEVYFRTYLLRSAQEDSFLRAKYTPVWQKKIQHAERIIENMATRAREKRVQLVIVLIPQRIQALLVKNPHEDQGIDPFAFSHHIKSIGRRHGVPVFDFLERLANYTDPASLYYPVDGHLTPTGQRILGKFVAEKLTSAGILPETYL